MLNHLTSLLLALTHLFIVMQPDSSLNNDPALFLLCEPQRQEELLIGFS